jgi:glycosyltransferase involved in cell wall biosynthesis
LTIAGRGGERFAAPGIETPGFVEDLAAAYRSARVVVAPLLHGSGTRLKIPEAMAFGRPVVATSVAAAGLSVDIEHGVVIADSATEFAERCAELLTGLSTAQDLGSRARAAAVERFSASQLRDAVLSSLEDVAKATEPRP